MFLFKIVARRENSKIKFTDSFQDELIWGAAWLFKATNEQKYWNYVVENIHYLENSVKTESKKAVYVGGCFADFGWDGKNAGINVLVSRVIIIFFS